MINTPDKNAWQDIVCDDLQPVLRTLKERHKMNGWKLSADPQGQWARVYLRRNLSPVMMTGLREQFANSPQLQFGMDWINCTHHNVCLHSYRTWQREHRKTIKGRPWITFLFSMAALSCIIAGGVMELVDGIQRGVWTRSALGVATILFFALAAIPAIMDLADYLRRK
jgi:hypothetical protein